MSSKQPYPGRSAPSRTRQWNRLRRALDLIVAGSPDAAWDMLAQEDDSAEDSAATARLHKAFRDAVSPIEQALPRRATDPTETRLHPLPRWSPQAAHPGLPPAFVLPRSQRTTARPGRSSLAAAGISPKRRVQSIDILVDTNTATNLDNLAHILAPATGKTGVSVTLCLHASPTPKQRSLAVNRGWRLHAKPLYDPASTCIWDSAKYADLVITLTGHFDLDRYFLDRVINMVERGETVLIPFVSWTPKSRLDTQFACHATHLSLQESGSSFAMSGALLRVTGAPDMDVTVGHWLDRLQSFSDETACLAVPNAGTVRHPTAESVAPLVCICEAHNTHIGTHIDDEYLSRFRLSLNGAGISVEPPNPGTPCKARYQILLSDLPLPAPETVLHHIQTLETDKDLVAGIEIDGGPCPGHPGSVHAELFAGTITPIWAVARTGPLSRTDPHPGLRSKTALMDTMLQLARLGPCFAHSANRAPQKNRTPSASHRLAAALDLHRSSPAGYTTLTPRGVFRRRTDRPLLLTWPDYTNTNPYQRLLYAGIHRHCDLLATPPAQALEIARDPSFSGPLVFHLHWINFLFRKVQTETEAHQKAQRLLDELAAFCACGGRLIWTLHNVLSHDSPYPSVERWLSGELAKHADVLHLHDHAAKDRVTAEFVLPDDKIIVLPHGHFQDAYPDLLGRAAARHMLGLGSKDMALTFVGMVRPYKGFDTLLRVFRTMRQRHVNLKLLVAGATPDGTSPLGGQCQGLSEKLSEADLASIVTSDRFLDPAEISLCLRAGDIAVLPYREALTSGSALLALSFGCPVILPDTATLRPLTNDGETGWLFNPEKEGQTLEAVIAKALHDSRDPVTGARRRHAAETFALSQGWQDFNTLVMAALNAPRS